MHKFNTFKSYARFRPWSLALLTCAVTATSNCFGSAFISEIHYDNAGTDVDEAIKITMDLGTNLSNMSVVLYNGSNGTFYDTRALSGLQAEISECDNNIGELVISYPANGIQNGAPDGIALVNGDDVLEFISYEGVLTAVGGPADGLVSQDIGVAETSNTPAGQSLQKVNGIWQAPSTHSFNACAGGNGGGGGNGNGDPELVFIHDIQGNGSTVAINHVITIEAIVTADFQNSDQLSGFFLQEEDTDIDANSDTSEGIFVYCSTCPVDVQVGDSVKVIGFPNEFFGMSQVTATLDTDITVISSGNELPSLTQLQLPIGTTSVDLVNATNEVNAYYERVEGMLVAFPEALSVAEYFQLSRFGQITLSSGGRPRQFTDAQTPSASGFIEHQIDLLRRRIIMDDDNDTQNAALFSANPVFYPQPGFSIDQYFRGGDTISNLSGVMHWSWAGASGTDAWRIRPVKEAFSYTFTPFNPRTETPQNISAPLKVANFNVLNYFTNIDDGSNHCGADGSMECRGADSIEELNRQTQKIVAAICALDADIIGLMEIQNPVIGAVGKSPVGYLVSEINKNCGGYSAIETATMGSDAITVGMIYRESAVLPVGNTAVLDSTNFTDPNNTGIDKNRPALAQSFSEIRSGKILTVTVNHLKSKGSNCGVGDDDLLTGQGNCNLTRTLAAQVQADWLQSNPTGVDSQLSLIIGDLNAYRKEDPIRALNNAGYTDLVDYFQGSDGYSYVFDGQLGYLDHALANDALLPFITSANVWHINSDEVNLLDYNDTVQDLSEASFDAKPGALPLFEANPYRSSDHDPVIIGIEFPSLPQLPSCNGQTATIYVKDGVVFGGPLDGQAYQGILLGSDQADVIVGTDESELISAADGNDVVCAEGDNDIVLGGKGQDQLFGGGGNDLLIGNKGKDVLDGGDGSNILIGSEGKDECTNGTAFSCE